MHDQSATRLLGSVGAALLAAAFVFSHVGIPWWLPPGALPALGIPSPLSGMTRSFVALAGGDVGGGFGWHPLGPVAFIACLAAAGFAGASMLGVSPPARLRRVLALRPFWLAVAACFAVAWVRQIVVLTP